MRKSITAAILVFNFLKLLSQTNLSFQVGNESFTLIQEKIIIAVTDSSAFNRWRSLAGNATKKITNGFYMLNTEKDKSDGLLNMLFENRKNYGVNWASNVLADKNGVEIGSLTNQFIVRLKSKTTQKQLEEMCRRTATRIARRDDFDEQTFYVSADNLSVMQINGASKLFLASNLYEFVQPDYLIFIETHSLPTDPDLNQSWHLNNTGQRGGTADADMDVFEAWGLTKGCSSIKVAILDQGVELTHPDLDGNLLPGFDATGGGSNGGFVNPVPLGGSDGDWHGTTCAGIVGAEANTIGSAGIAFQAKLIPVRILTSETTITSISLISWVSNGIDWAWQNGADIISMSIGIQVDHAAIDAAINRAVTQGRNNKGSLLFASAGNLNSSTIGYPASNPQVIAVGATDVCDMRVVPSNSSCGSNSWGWGSNFGIGLDVVAPGVRIYTTDLTGFGFGKGKGTFSKPDFWESYGGTSAACPAAAGVMALILSVNPNLTYSQARQILETNTDKVSPNGMYTYTANVAGQPNGTWNNQVGYGRVNAEKAVKAARGGDIVGPSQICSSGTYNFILQYPPPGLTVTWSSSNSAVLSINPTTGVATRPAVSSSGSITITAIISGGTCTLLQPQITKTLWVGVPPYFSGITLDNNAIPNDCFSMVPYTPIPHQLLTSPVGNNGYPSFLVNDGSGIVTYSSFNNQIGFFTHNRTDLNFSIKYTINSVCGTYFSCVYFCNANCVEALVATEPTVSIYPNPSSQTLQIDLSAPTVVSARSADMVASPNSYPFQVKIFDDTGQLVKEASSETSSLNLDVSDLPAKPHYVHIFYNSKVLLRQMQIIR